MKNPQCIHLSSVEQQSAAEPVVVHFVLEDMDVEVPIGASLLDVVEVSGADITFGCRNGSCGTCRIRIEEGLLALSPMGLEEKDFLSALEALPNERLGCQVCINGNVKISYVG